MPQPCTICVHPARDLIDRALVACEPNRRIAALYSVTEQSIRRHKLVHLPETLTSARAATEVARADDLLNEVIQLQARTQTILSTAEAAGDLRTAIAAIREARGNAELIARLAGQLTRDISQIVNVNLSPEWLH